MTETGFDQLMNFNSLNLDSVIRAVLMSIQIEGLSHYYEDNRTTLNQVRLSVDAGQVLCVLGPSGSGKSTLLRLIAGLEKIQAGTLRIGEQLIDSENTVPTEKRQVGMVFQDHALFPHMTVAENVKFGLQGRDEAVVDSLLSAVELSDFRERYPHTLSGGQQQRAALIRALANQPVVMLLDEPFANVDVALRSALRKDALDALRDSKTATILVTHEPEEAMLMADKIACLVDGIIVQQGTPEEMCAKPEHPFVALTLAGGQLFFGAANNGRIETAFGDLNLSEAASGDVQVCANKRDIGIIPGKKAIVRDVRFVGDGHIITVTAGDESLSVFTAEKNVSVGTKVDLEFNTTRLNIFPV